MKVLKWKTSCAVYFLSAAWTFLQKLSSSCFSGSHPKLFSSCRENPARWWKEQVRDGARGAVWKHEQHWPCNLVILELNINLEELMLLLIFF